MPDPVKRWYMPEWMETTFGPAIVETGGNSIEDLVNDHETIVQVNAYRAVLCVSVKAQITLLYRLAQRGVLDGVPSTVKFSDDLR